MSTHDYARRELEALLAEVDEYTQGYREQTQEIIGNLHARIAEVERERDEAQARYGAENVRLFNRAEAAERDRDEAWRAHELVMQAGLDRGRRIEALTAALREIAEKAAPKEWETPGHPMNGWTRCEPILRAVQAALATSEQATEEGA